MSPPRDGNAIASLAETWAKVASAREEQGLLVGFFIASAEKIEKNDFWQKLAQNAKMVDFGPKNGFCQKLPNCSKRSRTLSGVPRGMPQACRRQ